MRPSRLTPLIVASALLMENLDGTVIATSLPAIAVDIHQNPLALKLALTSYLLALAIFIPLSGWVADRFGAPRVFRYAIVVFTLGSVLCGATNSLTGFVLARFLQGFGGSMMSPVGRLVVLRATPRHELVQAFAWLTVPAMIGPMLGPPLGGFITTYADWRWIFWINVPVGLIGFVLASLFMQEERVAERRPLDIVGFLLSAFGLSGVVFGCTVAGLPFFSGEATAAMIGLGAVCLVLYVRHARRARHPLLDLNLLRFPTLRASVLGGTLFRIPAGAVPFLLPLMLQLSFGMNAFESGLLTFANALGSLAMKLAATFALRWFGFRNVLVWNGLICVAFFAVNGFFPINMSSRLIFAVLLFSGFFRSLQFTSLNTLGYCEVDSESMSRATSFATTAQQVAQAMGVAVGAAVVEVSKAYDGDRTVGLTDFRAAFLVVAAISAFSALSFLKLPRNAGATVSGRRAPVDPLEAPTPRAAAE